MRAERGQGTGRPRFTGSQLASRCWDAVRGVDKAPGVGNTPEPIPPPSRVAARSVRVRPNASYVKWCVPRSVLVMAKEMKVKSPQVILHPR